MNTRDLIPEHHVTLACRPGTAACCAFLASAGPPNYFCAKGDPSLARVIRQRLEAGEMNARGDNCGGPPGYVLKVLPS